jgi:SulP family sulfate permease
MARQFINPKTLKDDITAGLVLGVESVPDGLASGLLAAVNPIYGLYGYMMGTFSGAFFTSSVFMAVQATSAMSLIVASVPQVRSGEDADGALFALSILTGLVMLGAGLLKLGKMLRFVPNAVMVGFVNAVAALIILGQLGDFTGYDAAGANKVAQTIDLLRHLDQIVLPTLMVGIATILLILTLEKTRLGALGMVAAIIVATLLVQVAGWEEVALVGDIADIPDSLPRPVLPALSVLPALIIPAFALAFVGLVQGAGVSKNYVNPDGNYPDASGDFVGQGAGNIFSGLFQGMPVGGSVSATALVTNGGAKSRFANIFAGIVIAVVILLFATTVAYIALPAIAALLIVVGFRTLKPAQIEMVWKTGSVQQAVMAITFIACLLIPLQYAVLIGVALSVLLFVLQRSNQVTVKAWQWEPGELPLEHDVPETVPSNDVTFLVVYGSVFFATAPLIEEKLPDMTKDTHNAIIVLSLRGQEELGSTFLDVLERYAIKLQEHHSKLMLAEVGRQMKEQLDQTKIAHTIGRENIFRSTERPGETAIQAWDAAQKWLAEQPERAVEAPEEVAEEEEAEESQTGKIGEKAAQAWHHTQDWIAEKREESDSDGTPSKETTED